MNTLKRAYKLFSVLTSIIMLVQPILPAFQVITPQVYAQSVTPTDTTTPAPTDSITPTDTVAPTSTVVPTATDTPAPTPTDTIAPTGDTGISGPTGVTGVTGTTGENGQILDGVSTESATITPTDTTTPAPTGSTQNSSQSTTSNTGTSNNTTPTVTETPVTTDTPTVTPAPTQDKNGVLSASIIKNANANTLGLDSQNISGSATLTTNKPDYSPTDTVVVTGTNFLPKHDYTLEISSPDPPPVDFTTTITTDPQGTFVYAYQLDGNYRPNYTIHVKDGSNIVATTTFTDSVNPSASLDQYGNAAPAGWQNGNLNANQATYKEGDSVPYRLRFGGLDATGATTYTVTIGWQYLNSSEHALDYLTSFDRTVSPDPCNGVTGCSAYTTTIKAIPADPTLQVSCGFTGSQIAGNFKIWGGTITNVGSYSTGSTCQTGNQNNSVVVTFTANQTTPVLVWGGHIGSQVDWGIGNSASAISGSPYHMDLDSCSFNCGAQDRALAAGSILPEPGLTTQISATAINLGSPVHDTANYTVTNNTCGSNGKSACPVTGTTTFYICGPNSTPTSCNNLGTLVGTATNSGTIATSPNYTPSAVGTYCFAAYYAPDSTAQYSPYLSTSTNNECVTVSNPPTGTIVINKTATGGDSTFAYTSTGGSNLPSGFNITTTGGSGSQTYTNVLAGTYTVTETNPTSPWSFTGLACTDPTHDTTTSGRLATIQLAGNETVTCTYTNTKQATVIIQKNTVGGNGTFNFTGTGGNGLPSRINVTTTAGSGSQTYTVAPDVTYSISENVPAGWTLTGSSCTSGAPAGFTPTAGQTVTCTFNDTAQGTLTIVKNTTGGDGTFDFTVTGPTASSPAIATSKGSGTTGSQVVTAGSYSVSEASQTGWTLSSSSCSDGSNNNINPSGFTIGAGQNITCTFTNTKLANIIINKVAQGGDGTFGYTTTGGLTPSTFNITTTAGSGSQSFTNILPGTYGVSENTPPTGWILSSATCDNSNNPSSITINAGTTVTCTFTNTKLPTLTVIKDVVNSYGGTAVASNFTVHVASGSGDVSGSPQPGSATGTTYTLPTGSYTVSENDPTALGYAQTGITGDCASNGTITLTAGDAKSCTITNNDVQPQLTVIKHVINDNGGTALASNFTMNVTGTNVSASSFPGAESPGTTVTLNAGSYSVDEATAAGYTKSIGTGCSGTISVGQAKTCTITNNDNGPTLKLVKSVTNDNGGTGIPADWNLTATGDAKGFTDAGNSTTFHPVNANVSYALSESSVTGYGSEGWACDGGTLSHDSITLGLGDQVTCTVTNNDIAPSLTLVKQVSNTHGGTATADQWTLTATGSAKVPTNLSGTTGVTSGSNFLADTYTLGESGGPTGYSASLYSCVVNGGAPVSGDTIALHVGDTATCTVTNSDQPGTLIVKKVLHNTYGGTATIPDFSFSVNGDGAISFNSNGENDLTVNSGTYSVTETAVSGYQASYDNCTNVFVPNGGSATCTITNNDLPAHLTLIKTVVNDNGGTASAAAWTLSADSKAGNISGITGSSAVSNATVSAGTYTLGETGPTGYTPSAWNCTGGTQNGSTITLANGDSATCTITNNDNAPSLTLVKDVNNTQGGTATADQWTLTATGSSQSPTNLSGTTPVASGANFKVDTYTLGESGGPTGYNASLYSCVVNGGKAVSENSVTLGLGDTATCTITNSDIGPTLKLAKSVFNNYGGSGQPGDWTLTATGTGGFSDTGDSTTFHSVRANQAYVLSESSVAGYVQDGGWQCDGGNLVGSTVTLPLNVSVTCSVTNTDLPAHLTLVKNIVNDNGGTANATDWTLTASGSADTISGITGSSDVTDATVSAGTYNLSEHGPSGYTAGAWSCSVNGGRAVDGSGVKLANGDSATCTITNNDNAPSLTLNKIVDNTNGGTAVSTDWTLTATGPTTISGNGTATSDATFSAGTYTLSETGPSGYTASAWSCTGGSQIGDQITVGLGESATCDITNSDIAPTLKLVKLVSGGSAVPADWTLTATGSAGFSDSGDSTTFHTVLANTSYGLSESGPTGYSAGAWDCDGGSLKENSITLGLAQNVTCSITNTRETGTILVHKLQDTDGSGTYNTLDSADFTWGTDGTSYPYAMGSGHTFDTGIYNVSESAKDGYKFTGWFYGDPRENDFSCSEPEFATLPANVNVSFDNQTEITLCNQLQNPIITITKTVTNTDLSPITDKNPGDSVLFTLTVTATQSAAYNVVVTDLPSQGFTYHAGSATAVSSVRGTLAGALVHAYASPGIWDLGNMIINEKVILTYQADIDGGQKPGLYKDLAWGYGCRTSAGCSVGDSMSVLANAENPGFIADNFVGAAVNVVTSSQSGATLNPTTGQVLGASTELPATGADAMWLGIAAVLFATGIGLVTYDHRKRRLHA